MTVQKMDLCTVIFWNTLELADQDSKVKSWIQSPCFILYMGLGPVGGSPSKGLSPAHLDLPTSGCIFYYLKPFYEQ